MRRREFVFALGAPAAACAGLTAFPAFGQTSAQTWTLAASQDRKLRRIGMLLPFAADDAETTYRILAFEEGLSEHGWLKGETIDLLYRSAPQRGQLEADARALVAAGCEVLVAATNLALDAALAATQDLPIIFVHVSDPAATGRLKDLARPGGNFSGFVDFEYSVLQKQAQLVLAVAPHTARMAVLINPDTLGGEIAPALSVAQSAAATLGLEMADATARSIEELDAKLSALGARPGGSLFVPSDVFAASNLKAIVALASKYRVPAIYFGAYFVAGGGLMSYGAEPHDLYRRSAAYVDKCLKGVSAGELPVQFPLRFEMAVNLKAADDLRLTIPANVLAQAEQVFD